MLMTLVCFAAPGFAADPFAGRIMPTDKVVFLNDGQKVGEYTAEAPLPWNTEVKCQGRTGVRMDDMMLVFEDGSVFNISRVGNGSELNLKEGTAYFAFSALPAGLAFGTPQDTVVTEMATLNASTDNQLLKGYVKAGETESELGVIEGGKLMVRTNDGQYTIDPGQRILLAQAQVTPAVLSTGTVVTIAGIGTAAAIGVGIALAPDSDDKKTSPF